ncbi:MAG: DUF5723 family protein [Bacteroidales bacterium]|nr:DUF5723 family protein [Bacteroidales bacterium]MCF8456333.1 DUF5723 family protein [Bacteroidales bacterium]
MKTLECIKGTLNKILLGISFLVMFGTVCLSQELTMYNLHSLSDRHLVNPALTPDCKFYFGFPGLSSINLGYENRGMKILEVLENTDHLEDVLSRNNSFGFDLRYSPISLGYGIGKGFITFDISNKTTTGISLPKDLLYFLWNGNKDHIGKMADFSGLKLQASNYFEYSFGYNYQLMDNLKVGAKLKFLRGMVNFDTQSWDMGIYTYEDTYIWDLHSNIRMNASIPLTAEFDDQDPEKLHDLTEQDLSASDFFFGNKNRGLGFDLGAVYNYNEKITLSASVIDLFSHIKWQSNVLNFSQDTVFTLEGVDLTPYIVPDGADDPDHLWERLIDTISDAFAIKSTQESYKTKIGPRFFLAGDYAVNTWLDAGLILNGKYYNDKLYMAYGISGNAQLSRFVSMSGTFTMFGSGSANLGLGFAFNLGPWQLHLITDNILGIKYDPKLNTLWPATSQNLDFRFGMAFLFGRTKAN